MAIVYQVVCHDLGCNLLSMIRNLIYLFYCAISNRQNPTLRQTVWQDLIVYLNTRNSIFAKCLAIGAH